MSNGNLPADQLGTIPGTSHRVRKDLVAQTAALRAAFQKAFGKPLNLTDSYRPYSVQERIFRQRFTTARVTGIDPRWWNGAQWWRLPGTAAAATPGKSNHGWGTAIDWASSVNRGGSAEQRWMAANAHRFGWVWPTWARNPSNHFYEPWHYEATAVPVSNYRAFLVEHGVDVADVTAPDPLTPVPPKRRRRMRVIKGVDRPENFITDGIVKRYITTALERDEWLKLCEQPSPDVIGQYACDRIPTWSAPSTVDAGAIAAEVKKAIPGVDTGALVRAINESLAGHLKVDVTVRAGE